MREKNNKNVIFRIQQNKMNYERIILRDAYDKLNQETHFEPSTLIHPDDGLLHSMSYVTLALAQRVPE